MKKIIILSALFALSFSVANAQVAAGVNTAGVMAKSPATGAFAPALKPAPKAKAPRKKIELATGERIAGYYDTDDLPEVIFDETGYLGYTSIEGYVKASNVFEPEMIEKFVGGEITKMRFALADETTKITNVFICEFDSYDDLAGYEPVAEVAMPDDFTPQIGWNDVEFPEPVEVKAGKYYAIGFEYEQTYENYPLVPDIDLDTDYDSTYGFFLYGYLSSYYGTDWYYFDDYGHLCIQAVVNGGQFIDDDIAIKKLSADKYATLDGGLNYSFSIKNYGNKVPETYTLDVEIDGTVVETVDTPFELTSSYRTISGNVAIPADLAAGGESHTLTVSVTSINGAAPEENVNDDVLSASFILYEGSVDRQMHLIEQFTSTLCGYCPEGHAVIEKMMENNPGKYALASIHCAGMGDDPYYIADESSDYIEYFSGLTGYPSAAFDRAILDDSYLNSTGIIAIGLGYGAAYQATVAEMINDAVDEAYSSIPAVVSVDIDASFSYDTNRLTFTVSGEGVSIASSILSDNVLTVYLLEDGIDGTQYSYDGGGWITYTHDNVLRQIVTDPCFGDEINWTSGSSFKNTYSGIIDSSWVPGNLKILAFISGPMAIWTGSSGYWADESGAYVNNANMIKLSETTGITAAGSEAAGASEKERYTVDGRRLSAPAKGLNIVKMSDGTVSKTLVK